MIFTDRFTFVHLPKTGGTFVREALLRLYAAGAREVVRTWYGLIRYRDVHIRGARYGVLIEHPWKHAPRWHIPRAHARKPVLGAVRNPYDWYVSQYEFGWWAQPQYLSWFRKVPGFRQRFPEYPRLSFEQFVRAVNAAFGVRRRRSADESAGLGVCTVAFVKSFFRRPWYALRRVDDAFVAAGRHKRELRGVHLLRAERLNGGLHGFLVHQGYDPSDVAFVLDMEPVRPEGSAPDRRVPWQSYYTAELKAWVRQKERVMFAMFPEYDA